MAKCRRCGSVKGVGRVKTMSPSYAREWVQDTPTTGHWKGGFSKEFDVCMSCILKLEPWIEGKDFRLPGQAALEFEDRTQGTSRPSPLLRFALDRSGRNEC